MLYSLNETAQLRIPLHHKGAPADVQAIVVMLREMVGELERECDPAIPPKYQALALQTVVAHTQHLLLALGPKARKREGQNLTTADG